MATPAPVRLLGDAFSDNSRGGVTIGDPDPASIAQNPGQVFDFNPQVIELEVAAGTRVELDFEGERVLADGVALDGDFAAFFAAAGDGARLTIGSLGGPGFSLDIVLIGRANAPEGHEPVLAEILTAQAFTGSLLERASDDLFSV